MSSIENIYNLLLLIVSVIGLIRFKKLTTPFKILVLSVIATLVLAVAAQWSSWKFKTNAAILQLECISGFVFFSLTYYYLFVNKAIRKGIVISTVIVVIFFIVNALFIQPFTRQFPTNVNLAALILFTISSLLLFKQMLQYPLAINITRQSIFWFNVAILFYSTTMFLNLGLENYYAEHKFDDDYTIVYFWYGILYVFHILLGVSILTDNKEVIASYAE